MCPAPEHHLHVSWWRQSCTLWPGSRNFLHLLIDFGERWRFKVSPVSSPGKALFFLCTIYQLDSWAKKGWDEASGIGVLWTTLANEVASLMGEIKTRGEKAWGGCGYLGLQGNHCLSDPRCLPWWPPQDPARDPLRNLIVTKYPPLSPLWASPESWKVKGKLE